MKITDPYESALAPTLDASGLRIALVAARFNGKYVEALRQGAHRAWVRHGGDPARLVEFQVPGAFELPWACKRLALGGEYGAIVALGCVIRGDTAHFDFVAGECARGLMQVGLETGIPVIFGVLTVENEDQAAERADPAQLDKGGEAMCGAIQLARGLKEARR